MKSHNQVSISWKILWMLFTLSLSTVILQPVAAADTLSTGSLEAFFDAAMTEQLAEDHIAGATVAVVHKDKLVYAKGYGYADLEAGTLVEADRTLFYIGSDGKLFTWTAVMQLIEDGLLDLHADVNTYLDFEIPATFDKSITLDHLMTHTAGFEEQLKALLAADGEVPLGEFLVRNMPQRVHPPGEIFAYSNYGTALAGYIIERVSGVPFEQYLTEHLIEPLGMKNSAAVQPLPPALMQNMSTGYHYGNGEYDAQAFEWAAATPCAPVRGTATDVARFMIAHLNDGCVDGETILQSETLTDMHQQQFTHHPTISGMTYGFLNSRINDQRILWHMGESAYFSTMMALLPDEDVGVLVSYNTPSSDATAILFRFLDEFYPTDYPSPEPEALPGWSERAKAINGTYISSSVAHSSPQKLVTWLRSLPLRMTDAGVLEMGPRRYVEVEPWRFEQQGAHRILTFEERDGQMWLFQEPFAHFKAAWYQEISFHLFLVAACALLFISGWIAWPVASWIQRRRRKTMVAEIRLARLAAAGLGFFDLGMLTWFLALMIGYGTTFIFPEASVSVITIINWLAVPLTLIVLVMAVQLWRHSRAHWIWRVHYSLIALAGVAFLWFLSFWNLLAGV